MKRTFLALSLMAALAVLQPAQADKYSDGFYAAWKDMNVLGDKALAGDRNALTQLEQTYQACKTDTSCTRSDSRWLPAAAAASNLGWLFWTKEALGADRKNYGMYMYAEAARMDAPAGAFQVGKCIAEACLPAELEKAYLKDLFAFSRNRPWDGGKYERFSAASEIYRKGAAGGLVEAALAAARAENEILKQDLVSAKYSSWEEQVIADYEHRLRIVEVSKQGLAHNPTDQQRSALTQFVTGYEPQLPGMKQTADTARARKQAQGAGASAQATPPVSTASSRGANYEADKARARDCIREREELDDWLNELRSWKRDLNAWDREIKASSIDLQVAGGSNADYNRHNANVDAYNAEGRDYSAEKRQHDQAADAHEARCKGSFNRAAIDEVCTGSAASSRFCKRFR
ncbi:hypothetical protein [Hyphomonas jannaschiana]|uniref:hypothetical protein n=1 Tax=Hyphomonas jannaschiana TaxID=86 RepID=UPI0035C786FE